MPEHKERHGAIPAADQEEDRGVLADVLGELADLRAENADLRRRVRRLEVRSGRGLPHPSDYADIASGWGG